MEFSGLMGSSTPIIKKYKASAAQAAGTLVLRSAANASGQFSTSTTTSFADCLGYCLDNGERFGATRPYSTTQGAVEGVFSIIINPDVILRAKMVTGATGTAITGDTVVTAVTNGLTVVGGTSVASPDMDEGILWFTSGANNGLSRKITSTSSVTATVIVPFPYTSAVGDTYCYAGLNVGLTGVTLTTDLQNVRADIAIATGGAASILELYLDTATNSFVEISPMDHVFGVST